MIENMAAPSVKNSRKVSYSLIFASDCIIWTGTLQNSQSQTFDQQIFVPKQRCFTSLRLNILP